MKDTRSLWSRRGYSLKMTKNDSEAVRVARVRQLWNARPYAERAGTQVLMFYGWLEKHYPDLLKHGKGDP